MDTLKKRGTKAFLWDFVGKLATQGMSFIITIFLARLLEPSDFGLIAIVMVIIGVARNFSDVGLGGALIQRRKLHPSHYSSVFFFNIFIASFLTIITYLSAKWISDFYHNQQLFPLLQIMSVTFILGALQGVQNVRLRKELDYSLLSKLNFVSTTFSGIIAIVMAINNAGIWSLVAQFLLQSIVYNILIWSIVSWRPSATFSLKALTQLWSFGFRMFLVGLLEAVYTRIDYLIIGKLFSAATLGYFQRAKSLNLLAINNVSGSLMSVLFPVLSTVQNDLLKIHRIIVKMLGIISFAVFLMFGNLYLEAEEIIVILFSEKWLLSAHYFELLALSGFVAPINALLVNILSSRGNSKAFLRMAIYKKIVAFSNFSMFFMFGIEGYLYGLVIVAFVNTSITIKMVSKEVSLKAKDLYIPIVQQTLIALSSILLTSIIVQSFELLLGISLLLKIFVFSVLYFLICYIFKTSSFMYFMEELLPIYSRIKHFIAKLKI